MWHVIPADLLTHFFKKIPEFSFSSVKPVVHDALWQASNLDSRPLQEKEQQFVQKQHKPIMALLTNMDECFVYKWLKNLLLFINQKECTLKCTCNCTLKFNFSVSVTTFSARQDVGSYIEENWMKGLILRSIYLWIIKHLYDQCICSVRNLYL